MNFLSSDLRLFFHYVRRSRPWLLIIIITLAIDLLLSAFNLVLPIFSRVLFDTAYPFRDIRLLNTLMLGSLFIFFARFFFNTIAAYLETYVSQEYMLKLRSEVFEHVTRLKTDHFFSKTSGDLMTRLSDDTENAEQLSLDLLPALAVNLFQFLGILVLAFSTHPTITWLALCSVPMYLIETKFFSKRLAVVQGESLQASSGILNQLQNGLRHILLVKAFCAEKLETEKFCLSIKQQYRLTIKEKILTTFSHFSNSLTVELWSMFIAWFLGYQIILGSLSVGEVVAMTLLLTQIGTPIQNFAQLYTRWRIGLISLRRIDEILHLPAEVNLPSDKAIGEGLIRLENVSFSYPDRPQLLNQVSLEVGPGKPLVLVGESGGGKTTLFNLLLGLYAPQSGCIKIDGAPLSSYSLAHLRNKTAMVAQDCPILPGTVRENIMYGLPSVSNSELNRICSEAQLTEFLSGLKDGVETVIDHETQMSGGQRQRIALARALMRDPAILLFDEATSAQDALNEFQIQEIIRKIAQQKTVLLIAHRLSTVRGLDRIAVLSKGKIVETGTFNDLITKKGEFHRLYEHQLNLSSGSEDRKGAK